MEKVYPEIKASANLLGLQLNNFEAWHEDMKRRSGYYDLDEQEIDALIAARLAARKAKDFKESDRIRDELAAMGIALKDSKDPKTGEIVTTWEVRASGTTEVAR